MSPARAGGIYLLGNIFSAAVPFLLLPILTRWLSPAEYGRVVNFALLVAACGALAGLSAHGAVGVEWFKRGGDERARYVGAAAAVIVSSGLLVAVGVAAIVWLAGDEWLGFGPGIAALAALTSAANVLLLVRLVLWQSAERPWPHIATAIGASALNVGLSLFAVAALGWGGVGRIAGVAAAAFVMALFALASMAAQRELLPALRRADVRSLLAFGLPLVPHVLAGVALASVDRYVVGTVLGTEAIGRYGAATQLAAVMTVVGDAFVKAFNPWLYRTLRSGSDADRLRVVGAVYCAMPAFVALALVLLVALLAAGPWLLGPAFRGALELMPWLMLGGALSGVYLAVSGLFFYDGRTGRLAVVTMASAVVGVVASMMLVPRWGVHGAAAGFALTQAVLAAAAVVVAMRTFALPWRRPMAAWAQLRPVRSGP